jgi:hypothetical protein
MIKLWKKPRECKVQNSEEHLSLRVGGGKKKKIWSDRSSQRDLFISKLGNGYTDMLKVIFLCTLCHTYSFVMKQGLHDGQNQSLTELPILDSQEIINWRSFVF